MTKPARRPSRGHLSSARPPSLPCRPVQLAAQQHRPQLAGYRPPIVRKRCPKMCINTCPTRAARRDRHGPVAARPSSANRTAPERAPSSSPPIPRAAARHQRITALLYLSPECASPCYAASRAGELTGLVLVLVLVLVLGAPLPVQSLLGAGAEKHRGPDQGYGRQWSRPAGAGTPPVSPGAHGAPAGQTQFHSKSLFIIVTTVRTLIKSTVFLKKRNGDGADGVRCVLSTSAPR